MVAETEWGKAADAKVRTTTGRGLMNNPTAMAVGGLLLVGGVGYYYMYGRRGDHRSNMTGDLRRVGDAAAGTPESPADARPRK